MILWIISGRTSIMVTLCLFQQLSGWSDILLMVIITNDNYCNGYLMAVIAQHAGLKASTWWTFQESFSALMMIALLPTKFSPASKQELLKLNSLSKTTCTPSWFDHLPLTVSPQRKQWQARSQICNSYWTFSQSRASFWGFVTSCYREAPLRINFTIRMTDNNLNTTSSKYWFQLNFKSLQTT